MDVGGVLLERESFRLLIPQDSRLNATFVVVVQVVARNIILLDQVSTLEAPELGLAEILQHKVHHVGAVAEVRIGQRLFMVQKVFAAILTCATQYFE